mmetsp:Transcript_10184/g.8989  ORF Transcript_10184/g.8989 Transcript_10184/m.8989 type:complete len:99 (+) Transcript_10184:251-547(+)
MNEDEVNKIKFEKKSGENSLDSKSGFPNSIEENTPGSSKRRRFDSSSILVLNSSQVRTTFLKDELKPDGDFAKNDKIQDSKFKKNSVLDQASNGINEE